MQYRSSSWTWHVLLLAFGFGAGCASGGASPEQQALDAGPRAEDAAWPDALAISDAAAVLEPDAATLGADASAPRDAGTARDAGAARDAASGGPVLCGAGCSAEQVCFAGVCVPATRDLDGDGVPVARDCEDANPAVYPGAPERCNGIDDDCDGVVDPATSVDARTFYLDGDRDGVGAASVRACAPPAGYVATGGDCDDGSALRAPGLAEVCDALDNDCNGAVDERGCPAGCFGALRGAAATYFVCTGTRTFEAARSLCEDRGAHLVRVDDNAENNWLRSQADARGIASIWLGGSDAATEGRWVWHDGTRFWTGGASGTAAAERFTRWAAGEPNADGDEDCLVQSPDRSWNDDECTDTHAFVCER